MDSCHPQLLHWWLWELFNDDVFIFNLFVQMQGSEEVEAFHSPFESILRTVSMMLGDFAYDSLLAKNKVPLVGTAHLIYGCFLGFVTLILMNLLTGLAVDDITALRAEGYWRRLRHQAKFIIYLEDVVGMSSSFQTDHQMLTTVKSKIFFCGELCRGFRLRLSFVMNTNISNRYFINAINHPLKLISLFRT